MSALSPLAPGRLTGMVLPMALWALHFVVVYSLVGLGCEHDWPSRSLAGGNLLSVLLIALTAAFLVVVAALGLRARRAWRRHAANQAGDPRQRRHALIAMAATALAALAAIAIVFTATPALLLPPCAT
ncbi:MAG: hypothetical protein KF823_04490 [Xanthomonadales bacterium]|nr:hypothetical protein [Xanthomonadales bacterium]